MAKKSRAILTALFAFFGIALMVAPMVIQPAYMIVNADPENDAKEADKIEADNKTALDEALEKEFGSEDEKKDDKKEAEGSDKTSEGSHTVEGWERHFTKKGYIFHRPKDDDSIFYLAEQIFVPGAYINEVWKAVTYDEQKDNVDNSVFKEGSNGKEICDFPDEPQNLLNHNCDLPQLGTEFFQSFLSPATIKGIQNYQMTSSMITGLNLGMPAGIPNNTVPATKEERAASGYNYTALERFGYNLELTSYAGEFDEIATSVPARLLANIGFWGKLKLGGTAFLNGLGGMWKNLVNNFEWNPLKWGKKLDQAVLAGGVAAAQTVVDTSNLNVAATHGWKRPEFIDTLYNVYYATDKEIIEKQNEDLLKKVKEELKDKVEEDVNAKKAIHLMPEEADFPVFTYDPHKLTKESAAAIESWKSCNASKSSNDKEDKCGSEPEPVYMTEEEQFEEWKEEDYQVQFDKDAKEVGIDCFDESKNYTQLLDCYKPKFTDYGKDIFAGDKSVFKKAVQKIMNEYFQNNPHYDVNRGLSHYMCGDEEGFIPDGSKSRATWKWLYEKENTRTEEFLNKDPSCKPVRPSIEGAQYGTGDWKSTDTRYIEFQKHEMSATVGFWGGMGKWLAQLTTKITNTLISFAFSNIIGYLGIDKIITSTIETLRDSIFFPLATIAIAIWGTWSIVKYKSVKGYGFLKMLLQLLLVFVVATFTLFQAGNLLKLVEVIPSEFDKMLAEALITDETTPYCQSSGGQDKVRNIQCTVWDVTIFQPWVHAQWGTSYFNLNSDNFSISDETKNLVGEGETDLGKKTIKNWALYQLDRTKTGSITTADKTRPTGFKARNMYKIVDLQAGPKNGEGRDAKYFHSWAGHNTERGTIMFLSGAMGVLTLIVVGGLAIAKLDMTFQMAIRIFFLPFIFVIGLLPSGSQKTWQYLGDILGLLMKRIFVVLILIVSLNILNAIAASDSNYVITALFSIGILIAIKLYWREILRLINETDVNINQARDTIMRGAAGAVPRSVKQRYSQIKNSLYSGSSMAVGGAIAGTLINRKLKKEGLEVKGSGFIEGMKHGWQQGTGRGALLAYNRNRRQGFGLGETLLQSYNVGKNEGGIVNVMGQSNPELMANLFSIKGILSNKIYEVNTKIKNREKEVTQDLAVAGKSTSKESINEALSKDNTYNNLKANLGNLERAVGVINNMTDNKAGIAGSMAGLKPHELKAINQLFMNLNMNKLSKGKGLNDSNIDKGFRDLFKEDFEYLNNNPDSEDQTVAALNFANLINSHLRDAADKELNFDRTFYGKVHNIMIGSFRRDKALMRHRVNRLKYNILAKKLEAQETLVKLFERRNNAKNGKELSKYAEFMRIYNGTDTDKEQLEALGELANQFMLETTNPKDLFGTNLAIDGETGEAIPAFLINPVTGKEFPMRDGQYYDPKTGNPMDESTIAEYYFNSLPEPGQTINEITYTGPNKQSVLTISQLQKFGVDAKVYNEILMGKGGIKAASAYAVAEIYKKNEKLEFNKPKEVIELENAANKKSAISEVGGFLMGAFFEQKPDPNAPKDPKKFTKANLFEDPTTTLSRLSESAERINKVELLSDKLGGIKSKENKLRGLYEQEEKAKEERSNIIKPKKGQIPGVVLPVEDKIIDDKSQSFKTYKPIEEINKPSFADKLNKRIFNDKPIINSDSVIIEPSKNDEKPLFRTRNEEKVIKDVTPENNKSENKSIKEVTFNDNKVIKDVTPQSTQIPIKEIDRNNLPTGLISEKAIQTKKTPTEEIAQGLGALLGVKSKSEAKEKSTHIDTAFKDKHEEVLEKISASNERINKLNKISDPLAEISDTNKPKLRGLYEDEKEVSNENRDKIMGKNMKDARDSIAHVENKEYLDIQTGKMVTESQNQQNETKSNFDTPVKRHQFHRLKGEQVTNYVNKTFDEIKVDNPKEDVPGISKDKAYNDTVDTAKSMITDLTAIASSSKLYTDERPSLFAENRGAVTEVESKEHWKYEQANDVSEDDLELHKQNHKEKPKETINDYDEFDPDFDKVLDYTEDNKREETHRDEIDELVEVFNNTKGDIKTLKESRKIAKENGNKEIAKEIKKKIKEEKIYKKSVKKELKKTEKENRVIYRDEDLDKFADLMMDTKPEKDDDLGFGMGPLTIGGKRKKPKHQQEAFQIQRTFDNRMEEFDKFLTEHDNFTSYIDKRKSKSLEKAVEDRANNSKKSRKKTNESMFDDLVGGINGEDK